MGVNGVGGSKNGDAWIPPLKTGSASNPTAPLPTSVNRPATLKVTQHYWNRQGSITLRHTHRSNFSAHHVKPGFSGLTDVQNNRLFEFCDPDGNPIMEKLKWKNYSRGELTVDFPLVEIFDP